jgi:hypothetical protein
MPSFISAAFVFFVYFSHFHFHMMPLIDIDSHAMLIFADAIDAISPRQLAG